MYCLLNFNRRKIHFLRRVVVSGKPVRVTCTCIHNQGSKTYNVYQIYCRLLFSRNRFLPATRLVILLLLLLIYFYFNTWESYKHVSYFNRIKFTIWKKKIVSLHTNFIFIVEFADEYITYSVWNNRAINCYKIRFILKTIILWLWRV